ncbi:MAG: hypothetical protein ACOCRX_03290 [Candidatus Woesearchaeota archaeon]
MDQEYSKTEDFKNAMIFLFSENDFEEFTTKKEKEKIKKARKKNKINSRNEIEIGDRVYSPVAGYGIVTKKNKKTLWLDDDIKIKYDHLQWYKTPEEYIKKEM